MKKIRFASVAEHAENIIKSRRALIGILSVLVVVFALYTLILPAVAINGQTAEEQGGMSIEQNVQEQPDDSDSSGTEMNNDNPNEVENTDDQDTNKEDINNSDGIKTGKITYSGDGYTLSAKCGKAAGLPEDIELSAKEIKKNNDDYDALYKKTLKALQGEKGGENIQDLGFVRFYDISLLSDGTSIEPSASVDMKISYDKPMDVSDRDNLRIVHFAVDENGKIKPEVIDGTAHEDSVQFKADSFSVYAVAEVEEVDDLNNGSFSIIYYNTGVTAAGLNNTAKNNTSLNGHQLLVRPDVLTHGYELFVDKNTNLPTWKFEKQSDGTYYISTIVNNTRKYLTINGGSVTLVNEPTEKSHITITKGTGNNKGRFAFSNGGYYLNQKDGKASNGFNAVRGNSSKSVWMNLVDKTNLSDDDFVLYTARKVNLSDREEVPDGTQVIVYTRIWNEKTLEYEYYAIDHDGKMFQCYESGDVIQWVGSQVPTAVWNFTEIDNSTATYTSYKYQLQNDYSKQYLAPRLSNGGQVMSSQPFNLNMNGRRYGDAYTDFIAWDDPAYDYAGIRVVDGHIEQCHRIDTTDFYFAIIEPGEAPVLDTVTTVDNNDYGITMKMQNYQYQGYYIGSGNGKYRQKDQADVLGLDTNTAGLLTTNLDQNGYPTAVASNRSLYELYDETVDVNHLFLQSIYDESGYLEYDCTQNFAHLKDTPNASGEYDFEVYNDLGTIGDTTDKPTRAHGQFMPYNQLGFNPNHIYSKTTNETDVLGNPLSDLDPRKGEKLYYINDNQPKNRDIIPGEADYFFGMQMDATFAQTPSGLDAWGHDIIFEFSGDDDFWLYVDGELVLDIGGVHSASVGKINFRTGAVEMIVRDANGNVLSSRTKNTTLKELFESNYRARGMSEDEIADKLASIFIEKQEDGHTYYVFKDDSIHTMKMFYMERGAGSSNLHMRFNLTAVKPGEVKLQKTVSGTDSRDYNNIKFPYQIEYFDQDDQEWRQLRNTDDDKPVTLEGTTEDIDYRETYEINGVEYDHVYLITPAQTALIDFFGDDNTIYRIRECGVDTDLYDTVKANDVELEGEATSVENQEDYKTEGSTVIDRKRVVFDNHVDENALRSLSFTKRLYKEDEITPLTYEQDQTLFNFVVYMGDESEDYDKLSPCYMAQYCVLNPQGYYCMWSLEQQKFVSLNKTEYSALTPEEKSVATFTTSGGGEIEKIPAGYTVELHDCLVGTKYKIVESATDPGYKFMKYERDLNEDPDYKYYSTMPESEAANMGVIRVGENPRVYVDNKRGWGLTVKKVWSDARFMESHDPIYIGVYINDQLLDNTLRRIKHPATSLYYFFDNLEEGCDFEDYVVREVKIEGDPTVNANGYVTGGVTSVTPVDEGGSIDVHGVPKTGDPADFRYTVTYDVGTPTGSNDHVRTDTVNNTRNGVKLVKTDVSGEPLAGATFTLTDNEGHPAGDGSYTTGDDGLIAYAYLPDGEYILTETKIPTGYQPMARSFRLEVENNRIVSVEGADSHAYKLDNSGNMSILEVKNRLFSLKAIKVDQDGEPLENMHFALYRQVTTSSGVQRKDYYPINGFGYNDLISGHDGVIPKINEHLPPGTYYLEEKVPLPGDNYEERADLCFEITNNGEVLLKSGITGDKITEEEVKDDEGTVISINYTMKVRDNIRKHRVSIWKTDDNNVAITSGVSFKLYKKADYNDDTEQPNPGAVPVRTGTTNNKGILALDNLAIGEYRLVETSIPDGYEPMNGAVRITVGAELVTAMQDGNPCNTYVKGDAQWVSGQPNDTIQIQVYNHAGVELPESGGPGTIWIYMIGGFLTVACGVAIAARRRSKGAL